MNIPIIIEQDGYLPKKATQGAAAYDLYAPCDKIIPLGRSVIPLNFKIALPYGYEAHVQPRSGFSLKGFEGEPTWGDYDSNKTRYDCDVLDGKIDCDYRGITGVIINNRDENEFLVKRGTRIAQMTIRKVEDATFIESNELPETERGEGGFGHTGTK